MFPPVDLDKNGNVRTYYFTLTPDKGNPTFTSLDGFKEQDLYKTLFPEKDINGMSPPDMFIMTMPPDLYLKIINIENATKGFPSGVQDNFIRMLYLSAITITTVGYGDILPITTLARILVALEAILGVVVSGLFLNSIAVKISDNAKKN